MSWPPTIKPLRRFPDICRTRMDTMLGGRSYKPRKTPYHLFRVGHYVLVDGSAEAKVVLNWLKRREPTTYVWRRIRVHESPVATTYAILRTH